MIMVQLVKLTDQLPGGDNWLFELKYDGYRVLAFVGGNVTKLITRNGNDITSRFKYIANELSDFFGATKVQLDGELIMTDKNGLSDFYALQRFRGGESVNIGYIIFDVLELNNRDLRNLPLLQRKEILLSISKGMSQPLQISQFTFNLTRAQFNHVCAQGHEGIIAKEINSPYTTSRNGSWLKLKNQNFKRR